MKSFFLIILIIFSEISPAKWILKTKLESQENSDPYNSLELNIGEYKKAIIYASCDKSELNSLINEVDTYLSASTTSDFLKSSLEILNDGLNYAKKIISKEPCVQSELNEVKTKLTTAYNNLKLNKGKTFAIPDLEDNMYDTERGFIHPGGLYTQEDFDRVKKKIEEGDEQILEAFNILLTAEWAQPNAKTYPVETIVRGGGVGENYINAARGATIAFQNALRWKLEGNLNCAQHAVEVLMAWAKTTKLVTGDSNYALATGLYGYQFAQAAEIMRDYEGWKSEDFEFFKQWMLDVWYPYCMKFLRERNGTWENKSKWWNAPGHYWSNWGLCNVMAVISIGILCDDVFIYNQGMSFFKYDQVGTYEDPRTKNPIQNNGLTEFLGNLVVTTSQSELETGAYGKLGQMNESGRDIGHACMAAGLSIDVAHQGWQQGDDLFSYMDHRIAAGIEFTAAQTQLIEGLPWTNYQYGTNGFYYTDSRAYIMEEPCLENYIRPYWGIVIGIYEEVKGIEMPFSKMAYNDMGIDAGAKGSTSGGYDHMGYSFLLNKRDGLAPENKRPTELKGSIKYNGNLYDVIPSLDLEKSLGNINEEIIHHTELGGLINNYTINNNVCVPKHSFITLIPQLPDGEENTGNWKWNTGETTQELTIEVDKSYAYRVTYINQNGIKSYQLFTIAIQGDCQKTKATQSIYLNSTKIGNDTVEAISGSTLTLELDVVDSYGTILWSTGETEYTITIPCLNSNHNITAIFTNMCGRQFVYIYQLFVIFPSNSDDNTLESTEFKIQKKTNGDEWEDSNDYIINNNGILSIDLNNERQKYFYIGVNCDYSPPETFIDYIKLVPLNSDYFQECEITIKLIKNKIKYKLNLSKNSISVNSYGIFSLNDIVYNLDKININFLSLDENGNSLDNINVEKFEIDQFKSEEEFNIIEKKITTSIIDNKNIIIRVSNDNECFEPEINQYEISIIGTQEDSKTEGLSINYETSIKDEELTEESHNKFDTKILEIIDTTQNNLNTEENDIESEANIIEENIKNKVEELKGNIEKNFENNILHETSSYSIYFYNTSDSSQNNAIIKEAISNVNLMNCEKILKEKYNIPENEVLNIIKVDLKRKDTNSLQVEYEVYSENFQLLNLNHCKDEIVRITIPYSLKNIRKNNYRQLSEEIDFEEKYKLGLKYGYDILNPNSSFYNDICTVFDSEYSTDLIIEDRKKYYFLPQLLCEDTCTYVSYNISNNKVDCDCYAKTEVKYNILNRNFLYNKPNSEFNKKILNVNFKVFKCLSKGFEKFIQNIGIWILLIIFLCFCILGIFAILFDYNKTRLNIEDDSTDIENSEINLTVMPYELSLQNDKRNYFKMYLGTLKYNNIISFTFFSGYEKNKYLKIMMLLFFIVLLFLFNLFLFLDKDFTHIYLKEGKYDFGNEYPKALAVTFICLLINMVVRILMKEKKKNLKVFKVINNKTNNNESDANVVLNISENNFNVRVIIFGFIGIILMISVFLYLISFGGIFINNQKYLIIRIVLSLLTSFIIPFVMCLLYSVFRYFGLKKQKEILYNISLIAQNF